MFGSFFVGKLVFAVFAASAVGVGQLWQKYGVDITGVPEFVALAAPFFGSCAELAPVACEVCKPNFVVQLRCAGRSVVLAGGTYQFALGIVPFVGWLPATVGSSSMCAEVSCSGARCAPEWCAAVVQLFVW